MAQSKATLAAKWTFKDHRQDLKARTMIKNIFVTGGGGYVGAVLVPRLLEIGYHVTVFDLFWYGEEVLDNHANLQCIQGDIRNQELLSKSLAEHDAVIHLACVSNDPSFELDPGLGKSINLDSFRPLIEASLEAGVQRFIYASSSSVYGIKDVKDVDETMTLEPLTDYSRFKAECESILTEYQSDEFTTVIVRPATVCGYSPRQRLDVIVNILTNVAYHKNKITVFGGEQLRPNIHIKDMVAAYVEILASPTKHVAGEVFNVGFENHSVMDIASIVKTSFGEGVEITITPTNDNRSYHVSSAKIRQKLNFAPRHTIRDAVDELKSAIDRGLLQDPMNNELYFNIKRMQSLDL